MSGLVVWPRRTRPFGQDVRVFPFRCFGLLCCSLLVASCGVVQAEQSGPLVNGMRVQDGRDDVWTMYASELTPEPAPLNPNGDAVGGEVRRTADALVVTVRYDDIEPRANRNWGVQFQIDIPEDDLSRQVTWEEYRYFGTHRWNREVDYVMATSEDGGSQHGTGMRATPDFAAETVTIRFPEHCFKKAPWVGVDGLSALSHTTDGTCVDYVGTRLSQPVELPPLPDGRDHASRDAWSPEQPVAGGQMGW
jgi:hypothetical protein